MPNVSEIDAVKLVKPKLAMPCHYNTWPPIVQDGAAWAKRVEAETNTKVHLLSAGDTPDL